MKFYRLPLVWGLSSIPIFQISKQLQWENRILILSPLNILFFTVVSTCFFCQNNGTYFFRGGNWQQKIEFELEGRE